MNLRKSTIGMILIAAACLLPSVTARAAQQAANKETPAQRDARMKWWREARFGMFIHWGVYSVPAGTYHGKQIGGIGEWIMNNGKIPVAEYRQFAKQFNPVKFDADEWVRMAKDAGMKYIVITSKHHDGFAMFDSKATDWNITKATPFQRDPLKELAAACQQEGIKLGFYYSQAQDWNHPGGAAIGGHWDKAQDGSMDEYIEQDRRAAGPRDPQQLRPDRRPLVGHAGGHDQGAGREAPAAAEAPAGHHHQQPPRRRLPRRHRHPRAAHPRHRLSRPRLGNLHDDERHLGLQELRPQLEEPRDADPQPGGHRQQGRQLPAERRPDLRRAHSRSRPSSGSRRSANG